MNPLTAVTHSEPVSRTTVLQVRAILLAHGIPIELVLRIMEIAKCYQTVRTASAQNAKIHAGRHANTNACWAARLYLASSPVLGPSPNDQFWRVESVLWELNGHDQGWADLNWGQYAPAFSWYDACIFRPLQANAVDLEDIDAINRTFADPTAGMLAVQPLLQAAGWMMVPHGPNNDLTWRLQNHQIANGQNQLHVFKWSVGEPNIPAHAIHTGSFNSNGFVEALRPGDRIGIWMRAQLRGWECHTTNASVSVMYNFR